jgi:hypothetical protein
MYSNTFLDNGGWNSYVFYAKMIFAFLFYNFLPVITLNLA